LLIYYIDYAQHLDLPPATRRPCSAIRQILRGIVGSRTTLGAFGQLIHAAVDVGIARGAFEEGVAFIKTRTRPWFEAGVQRAVDEPHLILKVGTLATRLDPAEALVRRSAQLVDAVEAQAHP
jgi:alkylation response protein AidB-like acyl-CoA dehydrogenase